MSAAVGEGESPFDSYAEKRMKQALRRIIDKIDGAKTSLDYPGWALAEAIREEAVKAIG